MTYMFDTDIISYLIRGPSLALKSRFESENPSNFAISTIVYAEILYGLKRKNSAKITAKVQAFLENICLVDFDAEAAAMYAAVRLELEKSGTPIDNMDLLIAASAMAEKAVLVSHNARHFSKIKGLSVEDWC